MRLALYRREIEGAVYVTLDDKVMAVQKFLTDLASDPEGVRSLTWWDWIETAVQGLPVNYAARLSQIGIANSSCS